MWKLIYPMQPNHIKILYVLNALFFCTILASFYFYMHAVPHPSSGVGIVTNGTIQPSMPNADEANLPHYPAGNIDGKITSKVGNSITVAVMLPGATIPSKVTATILVDKNTQIYKVGANKDPAVYQDQINQYIDGGRVGPSPDPYAHVALTMDDLSVDMVINVLPKSGSVQGTSLTAQIITPLDATPLP